MRHAHSNVARLRGKLAPHRPAIAMASHNPLFAKPARRGAGPHSPRTRSALRKHTASRSTSLNGAVSMNRAASSLSSSG